MLYEALTGQRPFSGPTMDLLLAHLFNPPTPPSVVAAQRGVVRPTVDWPRLDAIVLKMLAKERAERYQDCQVLMEDLAKVWPVGFTSRPLQGPPSSITPDDPSVAVPPSRRRFIGAGIAAVGSALAAIALGLRQRRRRGGPQTLEDARRVAAEMVASAEQGTPAERSELLGAIAEARSHALSGVVVRALTAEHSGVAQAALQAARTIGQPGDAPMAEALRQLAAPAIGAAAVDVAVARAALKDDTALPLLSAAAASPAVDAATRLRATLALVEAKHAPAALLRAALATASKGGSLRPVLRRAALTELVRQQDAPTVSSLTAALATAASAESLDAAAVLAAAGQGDAADKLLRAAQGAHAADQIELCAALAEAGDARCLPLLPPLMRSGQPEVRKRAVIATAQLGQIPAATLMQVVPLLDDPDPRVALTAAVAVLSLRTAAKDSGRAAQAAGSGAPSRRADV